MSTGIKSTRVSFSRGVSLIGLMSLSLTACGGGSGGVESMPPPTSITPTPTPTGFTSWSAVPAPGSTVVNGVSQEVTFTASSTAVTSVSPYSAVLPTTYTVKLDASRQFTDITINNANRTIMFSKSAGDTFGYVAGTSLLLVQNPSGSNYAIAVDPSVEGWNYQSFGVWVTGAGTGNGSAGSVSVGSQTAGSSIPAAGTATFTGKLGGTYLDPAGIDHLEGANMTISADFGARSLALTSSGTQDIQTGAAMTGLDLTGTLSYGAQNNLITGSLTSANGRLTGPATGYFYGPAAQEIGGIFALSAASGLERFGGGFGGRRP